MRKAAPALVATFAGIGLISQFKSAPEGHAGAVKKPAATGTTTPAATPAISPVVPILTDDNGGVDDNGNPVSNPIVTQPQSTPPATSPAQNGKPPVAGSRTFTGTVSWNEFGPVEVQITVVDGKVIDSQALQYPTDHRRSQRISDFSIPILNQEAITAQSAAIDTVSGATYTSSSYAESLQSAIDKSKA